MTKEAMELIAELNEAIDNLEFGKAPEKVIERLENRIQAIMDEAKLQPEWFTIAQAICYGGN